MITSYEKAATNFSANIVSKAPDYATGQVSANVYSAFESKTVNFDGAGDDKIYIGQIEDPKSKSPFVTTDSVELIVSDTNPANVQKIAVSETTSNYKSDSSGVPVLDKAGNKQLEFQSTDTYTISNVGGAWSAQKDTSFLDDGGNTVTKQPAHLQDAQKFVEDMSNVLESLGIIETRQ